MWVVVVDLLEVKSSVSCVPNQDLDWDWDTAEQNQQQLHKDKKAKVK